MMTVYNIYLIIMIQIERIKLIRREYLKIDHLFWTSRALYCSLWSKRHNLRHNIILIY